MSDGHTSESTDGFAFSWPIFTVGFLMVAAILPTWFIWAAQGRVWLVYPAAFLTWTGYLVAHYGAVGVIVDDVETPSPDETEDVETTDEDDSGWTFEEVVPENTLRAIGTISGIGINIFGIAFGALALRQESLALGLIAGFGFFGGYVIAHYFDSGKLL